jgi:signal transduction histidine kinase
VSERERSSRELADAKLREGEQAVEERHRIARDLHDSVSQALFSTALQARTAQKAAEQEGVTASGPLGRALNAIADLTKGAQREMRTLIYELGRDPVEKGLVAALAEHASKLSQRDGLTIDVQGPDGRLVLSSCAETQLFGIGREALANVVKHAHAGTAWVRIDARPGRVLVEIRDDGRGFNPAADHSGHFGLESMRSRAAEVGGRLTITSAPNLGTVVRVEIPTGPEDAADGA